MYPGDKRAGKRPVGSSSSWRSSLPSASPFPMIPLTRTSNFRPEPTQSSSQVFSSPLNASPMFPAARWPPSASSSLRNAQRIRKPPSSIRDALKLPPPSLVWDLENESSFPNSVGSNVNAVNPGPLQSPHLSHFNLQNHVSNNSVGSSVNAFNRGPSQPPHSSHFNLQNHVSNNSFGSNVNAFNRGPSQPPPLPRFNMQNHVPNNSVGSNVNAFNRSPSQPPPRPRFNMQNHVPNNSVGSNVNAFNRSPSQPPPLPRFNMQNHVPNNSVGSNVNSFNRSLYPLQPPQPPPYSSGMNLLQQGTVNNSVGMNVNTFSRGHCTSQPDPASNLSVQDHIPLTNPVGSNLNAFSCIPSTSQPPTSSNINLHDPVFVTNLVDGYENAFSCSPYNPRPPRSSGLNLQNHENASNIQLTNRPHDTLDELSLIIASSKLPETVSNPQITKRNLQNQESDQCSMDKRVRYVTVLEEKVKNLEEEISNLKKENEVLINANKELMNRNQTKDKETIQVVDDDDDEIEQLLAEFQNPVMGEQVTLGTQLVNEQILNVDQFNEQQINSNFDYEFARFQGS